MLQAFLSALPRCVFSQDVSLLDNDLNRNKTSLEHQWNKVCIIYKNSYHNNTESLSQIRYLLKQREDNMSLTLDVLYLKPLDIC